MTELEMLINNYMLLCSLREYVCNISLSLYTYCSTLLINIYT